LEYDTVSKYLSGCICLIVIFALLINVGCNEDTLVGTELFNDNDIAVNSFDTLTLQAKTTTLDSVRLYNLQNTTISTFLIGEIEDEFFGRTKASLVAEAHYFVDLTTGALQLPDYNEGDVLDSMILVLFLDDRGNYGDSTATHDISVYRITDHMRSFTSIFSTDNIAFDPSPIGELMSHTINRDSVRIYDPVRDTTSFSDAQIRIPLNEAVSKELFEDLADVNRDSAFVAAFNGIRVESTPSNSSCFGINISTSTFNSRIVSYYHRGDTAMVYNYPLNDLTVNVPIGRRFTDFERDLSNSVVSQLSGDTEKGDSLLFIQAMLGHTIEIDLSAALVLDDILINKAELEMVVAEPIDENFGIFPPMETIIMSVVNNDGTAGLVEEVNEGLAFDQLSSFFGGVVETDNENGVILYKYKMNITRTLTDILRNEFSPNLVLAPLFVTERAERSIIFGPGHNDYPMRLIISATE